MELIWLIYIIHELQGMTSRYTKPSTDLLSLFRSVWTYALVLGLDYDHNTPKEHWRHSLLFLAQSTPLLLDKSQVNFVDMELESSSPFSGVQESAVSVHDF